MPETSDTIPTTAALDASCAAEPSADPYDDPPRSLRAVAHGPAHPAGRATRDLGRQLVAYRQAHGLTQEALARRLGWAQPNVARLEAGQHTPNLATLDRIARRLGLEITVRAGPDALVVEMRQPV